MGKSTYEGSIECLKKEECWFLLEILPVLVTNIDVKKMIQPKGLYFTRPTMGHYLGTKNEMQEGADKLFEKLKWEKLK